MLAQTKPPTWFWAVAGLLLLWSLAACVAFYTHVSFNPDDPANPAYDRQLYKSLPGWLDWVFAGAVGTVLAGAVALLMRRAIAMPLFAASLFLVGVQFGHTLGATNLLAVKGAGEALGPPAVIAGMGMLAFWFAQRMRRQGWIG